MTLPNDLAKICENTFAEMTLRFGMKFFSEVDCILLKSPICQIRFDFGRSPLEVFCRISTVGHGPFQLLYVALIRSNLELPAHQSDLSLPYYQRFEGKLRLLESWITSYCLDLLAGDASALIGKDNYYSFAEFMDSAFAEMVNLPAADPITTKYRLGGLGWIKELWERKNGKWKGSGERM